MDEIDWKVRVFGDRVDRIRRILYTVPIMKLAAFGFLLSFGLAASASAQIDTLNPRTTEVDPFAYLHAMEQNGVISALAFDVTGGQPRTADPITGATFTKFQATFSLYGNLPIFQLFADALAGKPHTATFDIYGVPKTGNDANIPNLTTIELEPLMLELPACDVDSMDPRGAHIEATHRRLITGQVPASNTGLARTMGKKQKLWTPANFRLSVNGKSVARDLQTSGLKIALKLSRLADGTTTLSVDSSPLSFTIPMADAAPYQDLFKAGLAGQETIVPLQLDYLDDNGNPLLTVTQNVAIVSVGPVDTFQASALQTTARVVCEGRSQIMLYTYP